MSTKFVKWSLISIAVFVILTGIVGVALAQTSAPGTPDQKSASSKIESGLEQALSTGTADYIVRFKQQADLSAAYQMGWNERGQYVYNTLRSTADTSQRQAKNALDSLGLRNQTFIAGNELYVWGGNLDSAQYLAALPEVESIRETKVYYVDPVLPDLSLTDNHEPARWIGDLLGIPYGPQQTSPTEAPQAGYDWGILDVQADRFWSTFGFQGDGITVANIDTGVQWDHPALINNYKCQANPADPSCWFDPSFICGGGVCDNVGHGTHTMGTMVAEDDQALPYIAGMAPNAQWIACKGCEYNSCTDFALNACADWILAPGGDPGNRPQVVNNSWGGGGGSTWYLDKVNAWRAAGVFPAFSAGNAYTCNSLGSPGDYQESFGTASHRSWDRLISDFSSKGPSAFGHDPYTKPNISAPGENICSTVPGNGWDCSYSGTSMASPHTAGAVALLWSCNPGLVGQLDQTFQILQNSADVPPAGSCGAPPDGEGNFTYGYGYLNIYTAGLQWCGDTGNLQGTITDGSTGNPIPLAHVYSLPGPYETLTDPDGIYNMTMLVGGYDITAEAFGYFPQTVPATIITDTITIQDFALQPAPASLVSGYVTDAATGWPLYASIDIAGYPYNPVWTDPVTGYYQVSLPQGAYYQFTVGAWVPGYLPAVRTVGPFYSDVTEDFALDADLAACIAPGYTIQENYSQDFEAGSGGFSSYSYGSNSWQWGQPYPYPGPGQAHSGANVWATNLSGNYYDYEDSFIESPDIDLSALVGEWFNLSWWQWLQTDYWVDYVEVQVSNDAGSNWWTIYGPASGMLDYQWTQHTVNLDPTFAVGSFRLRFHLYSNEYYTAPGWYIDDLSVGTCSPPEDGGLVVGSVYDSNLGMPLTGAQVSNDSGGSTVTAVTADLAVSDSFYTLFSPSGLHDFTAAYNGFNSVTQPVDVQEGSTVQQDFYLPAGHLVADPDALTEALLLGTSKTVLMNLINDGDGSAYFEISEMDRSPAQSMGIAVPDPEAAKSESARSGVDGSGTPIVSQSGGVNAGACVVAVGAGWDPEATQLHNTLTEFGYSWVDVYSVQEARNYGANVLIDRYAATTMPMYDISNWINDGFGYIQLGDWPEWFPETWDSRTSGTPLNIQVMDSSHPLARGLPSSWTGLGFWAYDWSEDAVGYVYDTTYPNIVAAGYGSMYDRAVTAMEYSAGRAVYLGINVYGDSAGTPDKRLFLNAINWSGACGSMDIPWLSQSPITGTILAGNTQPIEVTFDATALGQPGDYLAELRVDNDTPYGPLNIPITMTVQPPADWGKLEGIVSSIGYCDSAPFPLVEAQVLIQGSNGMTWTLMTDGTGYYSWWLDSDYSPYTVTVTYPEHAPGVANGVVIAAGQTTPQDIALRWLVPCVNADPLSMETTLLLGSSDTLNFSLTNTGGMGTDFQIKEKDAGFVPTMVQTGPFAVVESSVPAGQRQAKNTLDLNLPAMLNAAPLDAGDVLQSWYPSQNNAPWGIAYDGDDETVWVGNGWSYDNTIYEYQPDGTATGRSWPYAYGPINGPADAAFNWNTGMIWVTAVGDGDCIHEIDPGSGETGSIICPPIPMYAFRGLAYDPTTDTYFGGGWNDQTIYHFDSAGILLDSTYVGLYISGLAFNPDTNHMFVMVNYYDEPVYVLDVANSYQVVGQFYISGWQGYGNGAGLEIDCEGNLWAVAQYEQKIYEFDSGESANVCAKDVPWLTEDPSSGTLPADTGDQLISVTFDASMVPQPGIYQAQLNIKSDDPVNGKLVVDASMNVQPPEDWGKLTGVISSLGYCDLNPFPLENASVVVEVAGAPYTFTTGVDGAYSVWAPEGTTNVTVSAENHVGTQDTAEIVAGETTNLDLSLRWIAPCISGEPAALDVDVPWHFSLSTPFDVVNNGAGAADFKLFDRTVQEITVSAGEFSEPQALVAVDQQQAMSTKDLNLPAAPKAAPLDAGEVFQTWNPSANDFAWGIAYDGDNGTVWVGNGWSYDNTIYEYESDGASTGRSHPYSWGPYYGPADSAFNWNTGTLWTLDVGLDNCIHEMDPDGGYTGNTICGPWYYSQRGLAYDPATDSWFVGSWNDYTVYHIDSTGNLLDSVYVGLPISGLAYNPDTLHLFVMVNSFDEPVYVLDAANSYQLIGQFYISGWQQGYGNGAGLEIDCDGSLWAVAQYEQKVYQFDSGESASLCRGGKDAPWLTQKPQEGTVLADSAFNVELTFTAFPSMTIGTTYTGTLFVKSSDPVSDTFSVPVKLNVIEPQIEVTLAPTATALSSPPGSTVQYLVSVTNNGNVPDTYDLSLLGDDWPVLMLTQQVSLDPGESTEISLFVFIPASAQDGEIDEMSLVAQSSSDEIMGWDVSATANLATRAFYTRIVRLTPATASELGDVGEVMAYTLTLWNLSLVSDTIELHGDSVWNMYMPETSFSLDSFESAVVTVYVHIPFGAAPGDLDAASIIAVSQSDPDAWDESKLTTHAGEMHLFLPLMAKQE